MDQTRTGSRKLNPLTAEDLVEIAQLAGQVTAAELARRLGKQYFTVAKALQRLREGRMFCRLVWVACAECGELIAGPRGRIVHPACERQRNARKNREQRCRHPGQSTPYVARYRWEQPDAARRLREQEKARRRELWPDLPLTIRQAQLAKVHQADARDYPVTLARASARGSRWTADEDTIVLKRLGDAARDVALELGRTLWAVRGRRVRLRSRD